MFHVKQNQYKCISRENIVLVFFVSRETFKKVIIKIKM